MFLGLVVPCWVDCELSENFSCGGVNDVNVVVLNQDDDWGSGVGSPDSDVAHFAVDTQCDGSRGVDAVASDPDTLLIRHPSRNTAHDEQHQKALARRHG